MGSLAIEVDGVSKAYRLYPTPRHRALEILTFGTGAITPISGR